MSTIRVYELAKEVNKTNKEVLDFLKSKNIELTSHMSNVDETHANMVRDTYKKGNKTAQEGNSPAKQEDGEKPKKKDYSGIPPSECQPYIGEETKTAGA